MFFIIIIILFYSTWISVENYSTEQSNEDFKKILSVSGYYRGLNRALPRLYEWEEYPTTGTQTRYDRSFEGE